VCRAGLQFRCSALRSGKRLAHSVPYAGRLVAAMRAGAQGVSRSGAQPPIFGYYYTFEAKDSTQRASNVLGKTIGQ